jgi:Uma2 family endonuclease
VPEYWIVDPSARTIEVYAIAGSGYALIQRAASGDAVASRVLPDLVLRAGDVFP